MTCIKAIVSAAIAFGVTAAFAQVPASNGDDLKVTMRTIANPDALEPDEIVRKIPARKPKKLRQDTDDPTNDLATSGSAGEQDEAGSAANPVSPDPVISTQPDTPAQQPYIPGDSGIPDEVGPGSGPGSHEHTDDLGRRVSEDSRHHGEDAHRTSDGPKGPRNDKPPRAPDSQPSGPKGPGAKPPDSKPPRVKPPAPNPPGAKPPRAKPPDRNPPGPRSPGTKPPGPKPPGGKPPGPPRGPGPRG